MDLQCTPGERHALFHAHHAQAFARRGAALRGGHVEAGSRSRNTALRAMAE
jgi:hypothetical protein